MLLEVDGSDAVLTEAQLTTRVVLDALSHESRLAAHSSRASPPEFHEFTRSSVNRSDGSRAARTERAARRQAGG